jgi:hypothetical protein
MEITPDTILEAALALPDDERLALATRLLETIPPESESPAIDSPEFIKEMERRFHDGSPTVPWSEIRDRE